MSFSALPALPMRFARLKFSLVVLALVTLLQSAAVSAQQTFTGGGAVSLSSSQLTSSSSTLTIAGATGSSIATLKVVLNGVTSNGETGLSVLPTSFMLQAPNGGPSLVLLGNTGDGTDGNDSGGAGSGLDDVTITIQDGATAAPNGVAWPNTSSFTVEPSSYFVGNGQTPPQGSGADWPQTDGSATLLSRFAGIGINNGDKWTLSIINCCTDPTPVSISSWDLVVTYATTTPTTTTVASSANPGFTGDSITLTATVSGSGTPTGTVAFSDNGTTISGCGAVAVSSGQAQCSTTMAQGYHPIDAMYSGGGGSGPSSGSLTQLIEVHPTQSGDTWCNNTSFSAPLNGTPIAYPAMIPVSGYTAGSTVGNVTLELEGVTQGAAGTGIDAEFLLVAPGGSNNLDFLDTAFNTEGSDVNLFISDSASLSPNYGTPVSNDTYLPFDGNIQTIDSFPASNSPIVDSNIPSVPGTINFAAPHGKTNSFTLQQAFSGAPANGDWALYATASNGTDALTVGGWCISLNVNTGTATTTTLGSSRQDAFSGANVTLSATVVINGTSTPVTSGTVEFKDETTGTILAASAALNSSGVATVTTNSLAEGDHKIVATYSGNSTYDTSFASMYQRIDDASTVTAVNSSTWQFCNTGAITIPMGTSGAETPNPSNVFVTNLPGTLNTATLTLNNFSILVGDQLDNTESLVVGPTGAALDFFSNTADGAIGDEALAGNYTFADSASALVSSGSGNISPGTYKPTSYVGTDNANDVFTADPGGFDTLPGSFGYSATRSTSTFDSEFGSTNANGTWSLYFNSPNANANGTGAAKGWCLNLTENLPAVSVGLSSASDFTQGGSGAYTVMVQNNGTGGPTGDPTGTNPMTVTDVLNSAFTFASGSGTGWSCAAPGQTVTCTNDSAVADNGGAYPDLTINVTVSGTASGVIGNQVSASGAGASSTNSNTDNVTIEAPLAITSASSTTFTVGTAGSFTVTTTGNPTPTFSETGALPSGVTLSSAGILSGTPAAGTGGSYSITITASNGVSPNATQNFTLTVDQAPAITSANSTILTAGTAGSFTITATGYPSATFSETGVLPTGITLSSAGVLSGTPSGASGAYPLTITASNGVGSNATQSFTITVNAGPATHLVIPGGPEPFYTAFGFNIYAYDAAGNLATSYNGTVAFTSSDPGFVNLGPVTLVNGVGSQTGVLKTAGTDSITATDTTNPSITGTGFFTIQPGAATHIGLAAPSSAYVGSPISYTLTAYDLFGNVATSYGGTVVFTSTDPSAILPGSSAITNGTGTFSATMETVGSQTITATDSVNSLVASSGNISVTLPALVVTTAADDTGAASNCTIQTTPGTGTDASCSLRDALLFAANEGSGSITFDSTAFAATSTAAANTITLSNGTLTIPSNTIINGPTSGTGATLTNLVTVNGAAASSVFTVGSGATGDSINGLIVTDGSSGTSGGGVSNSGTLTINNSTISGNSANGGFGGGIANLGTLTVTGSTISGNSASTGQGSGIFNAGTLTVTNSTIAGNAASGGVGGGVMNASGTLTVTDSTISGNSAAGGGGIYGVGTTVNLANSIVSGNSADADIDGGFTDNGGNLVGVGGINLAPLGNYGGPAQTMIPLPGSPAICFINPSAATGTDQRGDPRTTTYNAITCQDSGAVQSNYSLTVSAEPPPSVFALTNFSAGVTLDESGNPFIVTATPLPTVTIPLSLNGTGVLTGGSAAIDDATGIATYSALQVSLVGTNDSLTANLTLNLAVTPTPLVISATGSQFDVELTPTTTTAAGATATYSAGAQNVTLSATVTSTSGTVNAGTVTFAVLQGATQIGASVTSGTVTSGAANASFVLPAGTAAGTYTIQATYGGTTTLATSSDNTHTLVVSLAITTTAAASATTPYNASAQSVTLTATVTSPSGPVNAGTVTFTVLQGATPVGTAVTSGTVLNGAASVSYALPAGTSAGTYTIQAAYSGTVSLSASSDNTHTLTVSSAGTTTATASAVATYNIAAQNVTLTATVTSPSGPVNAGTVTFTVLQGATPVGTVVTSGTVLNGAASVSYVLPAGTSAGTYTIQAAYSGTVSLSASSDNTHTLTVGKATATVTLGSLTQTYTGLPLSATATTTPSGLTVNFTYNGSPTSPTTVGSYTVIGTISDANYQGSATGTLEITQATPTISWAAPAAITYGTGLSATQLDASSTVAGTFAYNPGTGIVLTAGSHTLSVTFTPTDTTDYTTAMASVTIIVNQAAPAIVWPTPAAITYGTALSATQLDASSTVAGTFAYNPGTGTKLTAGPQTLSVTFTPTDTTDYTTATASVTITVNQAVPPIVWATPAAITYGTALSATQLDASSTVAGTFVYNPGTGTLLAAGSQTLSVTFTPTDTADYTTAMASVTLLVNDEPQTITLSASTLADAAGVTFGVTPLTLSATATSGLPVVFTLISGAATLSGNSLTINGAGTVIIAANQSGNSNYAAAPQVTESIPVNKALSAAAIASSVNPVLVQNGVTFTATVTSSVGTPTGTVTFLDGATPLGMGTLSGGVATFATSSLAAGSHSITAAYGGDANFLGATSSALTQQVEDFGFTISSQTVTVLPGGSAVFTFTVNPIDGTTFPAAIAFTASGLPAGATYTFSPASVTTGEGSTTVTLTIDVSQTQAGINPVNLHPNIQRAMNNAGDSAGSRGRPNPSVASGVAPFALALILLPFAGRLRRAGKRLGRTLSMLLLLVAGAAAIAGISGCGSTSGFFAQQQQSYTVTVTGTSGTLTHSASVTLKVE